MLVWPYKTTFFASYLDGSEMKKNIKKMVVDFGFWYLY